ncbi:MAG: hypothetical protein JWO31_978 [Phycisphaerales bacterium]|nr:hypothetical protein [Phycisphaerales bacterium]
MTMTIAQRAEQATAVEPDDLLRMRGAVRFELVDGALVRRNMGSESGEIAMKATSLLAFFLRGKGLGRLLNSDASYQCFPTHPKRVRRPDGSFIRAGRLPGDVVPKGHIPIPPDLAIEVVSPGDTGEEIEKKVAEYQSVGVPLVWVAYPGVKKVRVHRSFESPLGAVTDYGPSDTIGGEVVLPGFTCRVGEFFEPI